MTKEEAFKNLSLSADADIETVRSRFASRYTLSDEQYDQALTDGMKHIHEAHLRDLETSYKVITDSDVIKDMGALLSLGKGYISEDRGIGGEKLIHPEEALAFFAVYPHQSSQLVEERYAAYTAELDEAMDATPLEASKEPYRKEKERAEAYFKIAVNYIVSYGLKSAAAENEMKTKSADEVKYTAETGADDTNSEIVSSDEGFALKENKNSQKMLVFITVFFIVAIAISSIFMFSEEKKEEPAAPPEKTTEHTAPSSSNAGHEVVNDIEQEKPHSDRPELQMEPVFNEGSPQNFFPGDKEEPTDFPTDSLLIVVYLKRYSPDNFKVKQVTKTKMELENTIDKSVYIFNYKDITNIDAEGRFVSSKPAFIIKGVKQVNSLDYNLATLKDMNRKVLLKRILKWGSVGATGASGASGSNEKNE